MFPVLGFGARLPDGTVSHEFPCVSLVLMYFYGDIFTEIHVLVIAFKHLQTLWC